jgi:hypothetical protein
MCGVVDGRDGVEVEAEPNAGDVVRVLVKVESWEERCCKVGRIGGISESVGSSGETVTAVFGIPKAASKSVSLVSNDAALERSPAEAVAEIDCW